MIPNLTDDECDAFRAMPSNFNELARAVYAAGAKAAIKACADTCESAKVNFFSRDHNRGLQHAADILRGRDTAPQIDYVRR